MPVSISRLILIIISLMPFTGTQAATAGIASAHPLATQAGHQILARGGNAFDAAVAVTAILAVVEPYASGLGGGGFWLLHEAKSGKTIMLDGREKAPLKAHRDLYLDKKGNIIPGLSISGSLASGIPGVPAGLVHLAKRYGNLPLSVSLKPAIEIASKGYVIDNSYRLYAKLRLKALQADKEAARIFLYNNQVPPKGYLLKQPDLAKTLGSIARSGNAGFYQGNIASKLVNGVQKNGGIWSQKDLSAYQLIERAPVQFKYQDATITTASLPSSGGIVLAQIFGMLSRFSLSNLDETQKIHLLIESMRRAYADRARYLGDPDKFRVPVKALLDAAYIKRMAATIDIKEATPSILLSALPLGNGGNGMDTTHFSILDKAGNRVAATLSINYPFGACVVPPGTGVLLNDEMDDFSSKPGEPNAYGLVGAEANAIAPGKRPLSSMSPTFVETKHGIAILGTPGGSRIISMVMLGILDYLNGDSAKDIVSHRRIHHQYLPDLIIFEDKALSAKTIKQLKNMGHQLKEKTSPYGGGLGVYGNMQIVIKDKRSGTISAASDPRGHGKAIVH